MGWRIEHDEGLPGPAVSPHPLTICDLTQSYAPVGGGGVSTYLREKREHILAHTGHRLIQIVPGPADRVTVNGRHVFAEVAAEPVRGSPNYRFILRTEAVRALLAAYQPDVIESLCPWILPWSAIRHRRRHPATALVAGWHTDFPNAQVHRVAAAKFGPTIGRGFRWLSYGYATMTYREFDQVYALSDEALGTIAARGIARTRLLPLGVDTARFHPSRRDPGYRAELGLAGAGPLLVYAGRIDNEKRAGQLIATMRALPADLGAALVMIGDGKLRGALMAASADLPIAWTGFEADRDRLARALASSDLYVSAMADETFGISVLEAQASGLPVIGVAGGAMRVRVLPGLGLLGPVDDAAAMADNIVAAWTGDHRAMGRAARAHVAAEFSWRRTFDRLLGEVYPPALARAGGRAAVKKAGCGWACARPVRAWGPPC